jgi:REP element-mobilizing transposase RayT
MPRAPRIAVGGIVYHVLNRANARIPLFETPSDYEAFMKVCMEANDRVPMRILSYCIMPNHWHFVLWPQGDGDLSEFVGWLTLTHTQRWHAAHGTTGSGHLYQGGVVVEQPGAAGCPGPRALRSHAGGVARAPAGQLAFLGQRAADPGRGGCGPLCDRARHTLRRRRLGHPHGLRPGPRTHPPPPRPPAQRKRCQEPFFRKRENPSKVRGFAKKVPDTFFRGAEFCHMRASVHGYYSHTVI